MNTPATKPTTLADKVLAIVLVVWLLFFGGFSTITKLLKPSTIAPIAATIGQGAQQLLATAQVVAPSTIDTRAIATPARASAPAAAARPIVAPAAKALTATAAPAPTLTPLVAAQAPASQPAAIAYSVPAGQHTDINPDGSFTVEHGGFRYYPDTSGVIVEVRIVDTSYEQPAAQEGAPPEQKIFLDPNDAEDTAALAAIPTATPSSITPCPSRHGCASTKP
jgi:hypothetical protein